VATWAMLAGLGEEERRQVLSVARRRRFARGEVVFHRGDPADTLHLVAAGCFAVRIITPVGDVATLGLVGPGGSFGELALVRAEHTRSATVQALQAGETFALQRAELDDLRARDARLQAFLLHVLAERVAELTEQLVEALYTPAPQRVRHALQTLASAYADASGDATIPLTQDDLAGLAGTSRLTVSRVLRGLRADGRVTVARGRITVLGGPP
jgi:CRP/FNR family transcriptional regulator, cyclic AMP receptor protein